MAIETTIQLKAHFENGDKPTQQQFENLIDSTHNQNITGGVTVNSSNVATVNLNSLNGTAANLTANTVTTNANLTGEVTSVGNATTITNNAITTSKINNEAVTSDKLAPITVLTVNNASFPYTLLSTDKKKFLILNRTGGNSTIVVPKNTFVKGDQILLKNKGASIITITAATGVTIESRDNLVQFSGQYAVASLICEDDTTDANVFSLAGDLQ